MDARTLILNWEKLKSVYARLSLALEPAQIGRTATNQATKVFFAPQTLLKRFQWNTDKRWRHRDCGFFAVEQINTQLAKLQATPKDQKKQNRDHDDMIMARLDGLAGLMQLI
jgi:hypothetical protein